MTKMYHLSLDIAGFMRNNRYPRDYNNMFEEKGRKLSPHEAHEMLLQAVREGKKLLPCDDCPTFDFQKGCPGHEEPEKGGAA